MIHALVALGTLLGIDSCAPGLAPAPSAAGDACAAVVAGEGGVSSTILYAGGYLDVGTVTAEVHGDHLEVTYDLDGYWYLDEAQLWIGATLDDLPDDRAGHPDFGRFPRTTGDAPLATPVHSTTFEVPLEDLAFECWQEAASFWAVAHAAVFEDGDGDGFRDCTHEDADGHCTAWDEGEIAMGEGSDLGDATRWGWTFPIDLDCSCADAYQGCETAFAYDGTGLTDSTCFDAWGSHRWGWTNGPIGYDTTTLDLYAGADDCDLASAAYVGTVSVEYTEGSLTTTWAPVDGWTFAQTHTYAGSEPLPTRDDGSVSVAPSRYTASSDEYPLGDIHVIHHVVACPTQE